MVSKLFEWIKNNKLNTFLIVVVAYFLFNTGNLFRVPSRMIGEYSSPNTMMESSNYMGVSSDAMMGKALPTSRPSSGGVAPQPDVTDRKVITRSSMSLQVKNVRDTLEIIKASVNELGGYMVDMNMDSPEIGATGSIAVRIPTDKLDEGLERFRKLSIKVVSENISGSDITDEYIDIETRISRLETTKARFEEILAEAEEIEDILRVQREIFNLQDQIDSYKGRLTYMDGASSTTLIRIYLSTDELGLPYTPSQAWRPVVVFKQASRSMLMTLIKIANVGIWLGVYAPLIIITLALFFTLKKWLRRNP